VRSEAEAFEEARTVHAREFLSDDLVMTIIGFRKFSWEYHGLDAEASDVEFERLHTEQMGRDDKGTEPNLVKRVRQKDPISRDRRRTGTETSTGIRTEADITRDAFEARKKTLEKRVSGMPEADSGSDDDEGLDFSADGTTPSAPVTLPSSVARGAQSHGQPALTKSLLDQVAADSPKMRGGNSASVTTSRKDGKSSSVTTSKTKGSSLEKAIPSANIDIQSEVDALSSDEFIKEEDFMELEIQALLKRLKGANGWLVLEAREGRSDGGEERRLDSGSQSQDGLPYV
jgi:hypothetical protein